MYEANHLDYIGRLYDVTLNPEKWRDVLDEFCGFINAGSVALQVVDQFNDDAFVTRYGGLLTKEVITEYNELHAATDAECLSVLFHDPRRVWRHDFEILGLTNIEDIAAHPPLKWLDNKIGLFWRVATRLNVSGAWLDLISFQFRREHGPMRDEEKLFSDPFMPHFAKAVEIGRTFQILQNRFRAVLDALDRVKIGVFITLADGQVAVHNSEASRIVELKDGMHFSHDRTLTLTNDGERRLLERAVCSTSATANGTDIVPEVLMAVSRRSGTEPFLLAICPLRGDTSNIGGDFRGSLIFAIDPINRQSISTSGMETLFGLSTAEADVLKKLLDGYNLQDISELRNTTIGTVRSQIKAVKIKTNTNRQSDLVRLAISVNIPIDEADGA